MDKREKITYWFIFNVVIALLPLVFNVLLIFSRDIPFNAEALFFRGELLIVSAAIAADAVGGLIGGGQKNRISRLIIGGMCVVLLCLSSLLFAAISIDETAFSPSRVTIISLVMFLSTVVASGSCKWLSEV